MIHKREVKKGMFTTSRKMRRLLWAAEQRKKRHDIKNKARAERAKRKWELEKKSWGHLHPKR